MLKEKLDALRASDSFRSSFLAAVGTLKSTGVLNILREIGGPKQVSLDAKNYAENNIALNNWTLGYNTAITHLEDFFDLILYPKESKDNQTIDLADYGARKTLVEQGILTEEEYDDLWSK